MLKDKFIVFLNGSYPKDKNKIFNLCVDRKIICADGGANYAYKLGIVPDLIIGDLDSINKDVLSYFKSKKVEIITVPSKKDYTDFEVVLLNIQNKSIINMTKRFSESDFVEIKYTKKFLNYDILVLGATGKRLDMTLSNMKKLINCPNMTFITENMEIVKYLKFNDECKKYPIYNLENRVFSIIPITDLKNLKLTGFEYPLKGNSISKNVALASNVVIDAISVIECDKGEMYIIASDKK